MSTEINWNDISPNFRPSRMDSSIIQKALEYEGTPRAITYFSEVCDELTDYCYWFLLSTLWVSYTGYSDLELWKQLFSSNRPKRQKSIMKPSELESFNNLPYTFAVYRAHRKGESDWISYTIERGTVIRFARERGAKEIAKYRVYKRDVMALFLRREEQEIIILDRSRVELIERIPLIFLG